MTNAPATFAELHVTSNFSFLQGASHPDELVETAARLGYQAIALTDDCSLAGIVKAHVAAKAQGIQLLVGSFFRLQEDPPLSLVLLAPHRQSYGELSTLISLGRRRAPKGEYQLHLHDVERIIRSCLALWIPDHPLATPPSQMQSLKALFPDRLWIAVELLADGNEAQRYQTLRQAGQRLALPLVACNDVRMHVPDRKALLDTLTAIRLNQPVQALGQQTFANAERHLRPISRLADIYPPELLEESIRICQRCHFSLEELRYEYPEEIVPPGRNAADWLAELTWQGAKQRWPQGLSPSLTQQLEKELALIRELRYEHFFLTVHDIVIFARAQGILCQGRGSAANSAVCFCLGITEVDPAQSQLLFERFISRERDEPPDIDVDFEHERREEVIQYIYRKYTPERAALAATVITYRTRSAIRDVGKALGLDTSLLESLSHSLAWWDKPEDLKTRCQEIGLSIDAPLLRHFYALVMQIRGFPRHLSQHVGGFVIARQAIALLVPVENAAMANRYIIQWDKEDLEALGLLKVDVLALGMLTALRKTLQLLSRHSPQPMTLAQIPKEDPATYAMLARGDSMGVFQVESRAQMAMLPRLRPHCFYDLVVQVAIVRPGPIQGGMVHPYLRRRNGEEPIEKGQPGILDILGRTYGVPIFQEQVIKLAMVAGGFSGGEADQLRRAMGSWRKSGQLLAFREKLLHGMTARGYSAEFAERLFQQIMGFGEYGFPESHAASFALLVYFSAWLKCHHPAAFCCALLNSQPMGFYSSSQLLQDARRHGVPIFDLDVRHSAIDHQLEIQNQRQGIRLGLRLAKGLSADTAERIVQARSDGDFRHLTDLKKRAALSHDELQNLIAAGACRTLSRHRHQAHWEALAISDPLPLDDMTGDGDAVLSDDIVVPVPTPEDNMLSDYRHTGVSLHLHPLQLLRRHPRLQRCHTARELSAYPHGRFIRIAGLVTGRQRPGTASGVLFMTLEDETGNANVVIWPSLQTRRRKEILTSTLVEIKGVVESSQGVVHVIAGDISDISGLLPELDTSSRDFH